jgi:hypothetical protein
MRMRLVRHTDGCTVLVRKSEGKRELLRPGCREEDIIKMGFKEIGFEVVDWIHLVDGLMNMVMNLLSP